MSLDVSPDLLDAAERGEVTDEQFAECVRDSLPYAWRMVSDLSTRLHVDGADGTGFVDNTTPPPDEQARGQLLRALASDAIRGCLERHFAVKLAFQNCHRVAVFPVGTSADSEVYGRFTSVRAQLLNQSPLLRDC
ncbi:hypothetical protein ABH926_009797 [Catenulispora sp. GP43]|uniref:SCO5389 family protein n=1 Tax=Catenulispora sp. GP43 TaxID=3156263 RepID=UPI003517BD93